MKSLFSLILFSCFFQVTFAQTDSLNNTDDNGLKQGHWIIFGASKPNSCYQPAEKIQEGMYVDNKKDGIWLEYFCGGQIKSKITFEKGRPNGPAVIYHKNGRVSEKGTFIMNKWVGEFFLYYESGIAQQVFIFNEAGKKEGLQKHYYKNGILQIITSWSDNKGYAYIQFDTTGRVISMGLKGKDLKESDKLNAKDEAFIKTMMDVAAKENKLASQKKEPEKKKKTKQPQLLQDVDIDPKKIKERN